MRLHIWLASLTLMFMASCHQGQKPTKSIPLGDTNRNALDWPGTYRGVLPCADCEGIAIELTLLTDETYILKSRHKGQSEGIFKSKGTFQWDTQERQVMLQDEDDGDAWQFLVGENRLIKLDREGQRIRGKLATDYELRKIDPGMEGHRWKLVSMNSEVVNKEQHTGTEITLLLDPSTTIASGSGGCNRYTSRYTLSGKDISFAAMAATKMACKGPNIEQEYFDALGSSTVAVHSDGNLLLSDDKGKILLKFEDWFFGIKEQ